MINTIEELEALPAGSVIKSKRNTVLEKGIDIWWAEDNVSWTDYEVATHFTPATLLIPNTVSQEKFMEALREFLKPRHGVEIEGEYIPAFAVALKLLGIEVSDV